MCEFAARLRQFKLWKLLAMVDSIVLVGVLTCCAWLHCACDLKAALMNMQ